ncbi:MAG: hypothetical protein IAF02_26580 [Anaerolineae bacterium]|nr:hypothetical protein [Anaerolineae bacterium]
MFTVKIKLLVASLILLLVACGVQGPTPTVPSAVVIVALPKQTPKPEPTLTATSTVTATTTAVPTQTSTPSPTATPDPSCPEPGSAAPFAYPADMTKLQASILAYLNAGGQWQDLMALFDELEIEHDWIQADMNGDGVEETAVYAKKYLAEDFIPDHAWWIFQCGSNQYHTILDVEDHWAFHGYFIADDLNNDHREEIIAISGFAGTACAFGPKVWSLQGEEIVDLSPKYGELELGCSLDGKVILQDIDSDNLKEMTLIGDTVAHLDNAPQRYITQTFTLENTGYKLITHVTR